MKQLGARGNIKLQPGLAWETGIKPKSLDLVLDRGTMPWISSLAPGKERETILHYLSLVKRKGKIILLRPSAGTTPTYEGVIRQLEELAAEKKLSFKEVPVKTPPFKITGNGEKEIKLKPIMGMSAAIIITKL